MPTLEELMTERDMLLEDYKDAQAHDDSELAMVIDIELDDLEELIAEMEEWNAKNQ